MYLKLIARKTVKIGKRVIAHNDDATFKCLPEIRENGCYVYNVQ